MPSQLELELLNRQAYAPKSADEAIQDSVIDFWNKITTPTMPDVDEDLSQVTGGLSGLVADTSPLGLLGMAPMIKGGTGIKGLYSRLNKAVEAMPDKLSVAAAKSWLTQRAGKEEASWRNIEKILGNRNPQDKVSKAELAAHLEANPLNVKTTTLADVRKNDSVTGFDPDILPPKYSKYTLPGGKNYREDLIQLDKKKPNGKPIDFAASPEEIAAQLEAPIVNAHIPDNTYYSSHWNEPNILAHVRHNQRTLPAPERVPKDILSDVDPNEFGSKGRFIEEIQSDWHETGRERGYKTPGLSEEVDRLNAKYREAFKTATTTRETNPRYFVDDIYHSNAPVDISGPEYAPSMDEVLADKNLEAAYSEWDSARKRLEDGVPDAPFKEDWANLALKQQLMDVVEDPNLEWMGWTPGSVQNDRYDLSNHIDSLSYEKNPVTGEGVLWGHKNGQTVLNKDVNNDDDLVALIGKDAASRLVNKGPVSTNEGEILYELTGEDLQIGGQGMTDFYDRQLPEKMNKILKGFGGKVEKGPLMVKKGTDMYSTGTEDDNFISMKGGNINVNDEHIASAIPRWTPENFRETNQAGDEVMGLLRERFKNQPQFIQAWIARLSPEMKERIKKEGLPLLMLLLAREMEGQDGSNQAEELR